MGSIEHLTDNQKEMINKKLEDAIKFMEGVKADREQKKLFEDPAYTCDQIINTMNSLKYDTESIFNLPPPKPKSPEKPAEESVNPTEGMEEAFKEEEGAPADEAKAQAEPNPDVEM